MTTMAFPVMFHFGSLAVSAHAVMEFLAFTVGFRYFLYLRKKQGDNYDNASRLWIIIGAIFGSIIGSRLVGSLERPYELAGNQHLFDYIYNNKTVVGGFLGGLLGVEVTKWIIHEKRSSGDLFVYPMILALIIGRIGCFSMGVYEETYGIPSKLPFALDLGDGIYRHPVALYEIAFLVLLWVFFRRLQKARPLQEGALFKLFMIAYLLFRFLLDFIKPHYFDFPLTTIQLACLAGLLYYLPFILNYKKQILAYA